MPGNLFEPEAILVNELENWSIREMAKKYSEHKVMMKITFCLSILLLSVWVSNAQTIPASITNQLNTSYKGWTKVPGFCEGKKWALTGDFNGDKKTDYVVRFKVGKKSSWLFLFAFINKGGKYTPVKITEDDYSDDFLRSAFSIIKKGIIVSLGQGEEATGPSIKLKTDSVTQYICETDAAKTFVFNNGEFKNIQDQ
jgi:hypothetical protein